MSEYSVAELEKMLADAKTKAAHAEYPKWVTLHASHIAMTGDHVSVPMFPEFYIDRAGNVTVKVDDAEHEAKAMAAKEEPKSAAGVEAA